MTTLSGLLICAAVLECLAGLALMLAPRVAIILLFGVAPGVTATIVARLAGVALFSLGIACWGARADQSGTARTGTVRGITFYNAGAGFVLMAVAISGSAIGLLIWIAGIVHLALAAAFAEKAIWPRRVA